jgi:hypothetical protein
MFYTIMYGKMIAFSSTLCIKVPLKVDSLFKQGAALEALLYENSSQRISLRHKGQRGKM